MVADQVDARDMAVDAVRHRKALDLPQVLRAGEHSLRWDRALFEDELAAVNVIEEEVERGHSLLEPRLEAPPGLRRNHARDDVEREDLLSPLGVRIDGESDPVVAEHLDCQVVAPGKLARP